MSEAQNRSAVAAAASEALKALDGREAPRVLLGFDGFIDNIIRVVDQRQTTTQFSRVPTIKAFAEKIHAADGRSANFEFVVTQTKLGGNGPIMANALMHGGAEVAYVGALGANGTIDPVFADFAERASCHSVCEPGVTDAVEFDNGKLMFGKYHQMSAMDADMLKAALPDGVLERLVGSASLIGMANWTMLPNIESAWAHVASLIPEADRPEDRPYLFVDFADPAKRPREHLRSALDLLTRMQDRARVVLGMNLSESDQVLDAMQQPSFSGNPDDRAARDAIVDTAERIREVLGITGAVVHPREAAAAAMLVDGRVSSARFAGPYIGTPRLSTGAGDNFNAGFCLGLLAGLDVAGCLACGTGTSGFYVREARSPERHELARFLQTLPPPEA